MLVLSIPITALRPVAETSFALDSNLFTLDVLYNAEVVMVVPPNEIPASLPMAPPVAKLWTPNTPASFVLTVSVPSLV